MRAGCVNSPDVMLSRSLLKSAGMTIAAYTAPEATASWAAASLMNCQPSWSLFSSCSTTCAPTSTEPVRSEVAPSSRLTTATPMFEVFEYGSQNALMLNHAYRAGVTSTPTTMTHVLRARASRPRSRVKTRQLICTLQTLASFCTPLCKFFVSVRRELFCGCCGRQLQESACECLLDDEFGDETCRERTAQRGELRRHALARHQRRASRKFRASRLSALAWEVHSCHLHAIPLDR